MAMLIRNIYISKQCSFSIAFIIAFSTRYVSGGDAQNEQKKLKEKKHFNSFILAFSQHSIFQMVTSQDKNLCINWCEIWKKKGVL